ncbi:hypothetical protein D3C86_2008020 [compost metagenome]
MYTPRQEELERAMGIVQAYEEAQQQGRSSSSYMGKMVDPPVYLRAQLLLKRNTILVGKE